MTENTVLIIVLSAALFSVLLLVWAVFKKRKPGGKNTPYVEALNALVSGDRETALQKLRESVRIDSHNVDAYLKLGNLLREEGDVERALKLHKSLTVRALSPTQRTDVLRAMASDYVTARRYAQARHLVEEILSHDKKEVWALETLLRICEETGQWDRAFETVKQIQRVQGEEDRELLALYKVCAGQTLDEKGEHHQARLKYKEAIRIDEHCTPAYLYLGDSYVAERRLDDAITYWKKLMETVPEHAYLSFGRLEKAHFDLGDFGSVAQIYQNLIDRTPGDLRPLFALVTILMKMGNIEEAIDLCHRALEQEPESQQARWCLVKCYHAKGDDSRAVAYALELEENTSVDILFRCKSCGHSSQEPLWRCPECKAWRTFLQSGG
ncbi:MAG: tetratricopeptide repeat protein [bacterium]